MKKRSQSEIDAQIEGLKKDKKKLPEFSAFGDKNWEKIDAQIDILEGKGNSDSLYIDETADEYEEGDNDIYFAAKDAENWLDGSRDEDLFDEE